MDNETSQFIYSKFLTNPEDPIARQNTIAIPNEYVPYDLALIEVEKQKFPNIFCNKLVDFRGSVDFKRIHHRAEYYSILEQDKSIKKAEGLRQKAREYLNKALINGEFKSYLLVIEKEEKEALEYKELKAEWWRTPQPMQIDSISYLWGKNGSKLFTKGLVLLDRQGLVRWGDGKEKPRRGRKKGSGGIDDSEALEFMKELVNKGYSIHKAAITAVDTFNVKGNSFESDVRRLERKFKKLINIK